MIQERIDQSREQRDENRGQMTEKKEMRREPNKQNQNKEQFWFRAFLFLFKTLARLPDRT